MKVFKSKQEDEDDDSDRSDDQDFYGDRDIFEDDINFHFKRDDGESDDEEDDKLGLSWAKLSTAQVR